MSRELRLRRFSPLAVLLAVFMLAALLLNQVATIARADSAGYALRFDGNNDLVQLATTSLMMAPTWKDTKTIELWIKPEGVSQVCAYNSIGFCDNIFGDRPRWWGIVRGVINGLDRIWLWNYDGSSNSNFDFISIDYIPNEWVHLAMVHNGGMLTVYKNGLQVGSVPSGMTLQPNTGAYPVLYIGGIINASTRNWTFEGQLDEVRVWNIARTQQEIQADMNRVLTGSELGIAAYYQMSNGAGLTLTDDSVNNWDGALLDGFLTVPPDGIPPQWVLSDAFGSVQPPTATPVPPTATFTPLPTNTPENSPTATATLVSPPTATPVTPTATPVTSTATPVTPTATPVTPTATPVTPTATPVLPSPTPTIVPTQGPQIFSDGFESGSLSAWSSSSTGGGDLSVTTAAALLDAYGMQILVDDTYPKYVVNDSPVAETHYQAAFRFDPNTITMANLNHHVIFQAYQGANQIIFRIGFQYANGQYQVQSQALDDSNIWRSTPWITISDAPHQLVIDWVASAPASSNGSLTLTIDGIGTSVAGISNSSRSVDSIRLGAISGIDTGTRGTYYFDDFASFR